MHATLQLLPYFYFQILSLSLSLSPLIRLNYKESALCWDADPRWRNEYHFMFHLKQHIM